MKHYSKEDLEMYRNGELSLLGRINCSSHLQQCKVCQKLLAEIESDDKLLKDLRTSIKIFKETKDNAAHSNTSRG